MKKLLLLIINLFILHLSGFSQSYLAEWNSATSSIKIKQVDLKTNVVTEIGESTKIHGQYDIEKIYFDKKSNQIVALFERQDLWKYDLTTKTDTIINLGNISYTFFFVEDDRAFLMYYTNAANYQIQEIDLGTNTITNIGVTSAVASYYHIYEVKYDKYRNQLVALYENNLKLWKYNLQTKKDNVILIGGVTGSSYSDILITPQDSYVTALKYSSSLESIQIQKIDFESGGLSNLFKSTLVKGRYDLNDLLYDQQNNQIVSLYNYNSLWKFNLNTNSEEISSLNNITYKSLAIYNKPKTPASVVLSDLTATYNGSGQPVTATTTPSGLAVNITYNGLATVPKNTGTYSVVATINDPDYSGKSTGSLVISKAPAAISLNNLTTVYTGSPQGATVSITPSDLNYTVTYNGSTAYPTNAGTYTVLVVVNDLYPYNYEGSKTGDFKISKANAEITLTNLSAVYDGSGKEITIITKPTDLEVEVLYNGSASKPTEVAQYTVEAVIKDPNYQGSASGSFTISSLTTAVTKNHWEHVQLFPNPAKDFLYINSVADVTTICISDVLGNMQLKKNNCSPSEQFDVSNFSKGFYIITIESLSGKQSYRLVIN